MPTQHTNTNNCGIFVLSKEPAMHHTAVVDHRWSKRQADPSRLLLGLMLLVACITITLPTVPAQAVTPDSCPNAQLRALNNSSSLPDCRAYEMVTSPFKQGFDPKKPTYGDGAVAYYSTGSFGDNQYGGLGNQYVARRSETGWKSVSMTPPGEQWVFEPNPEGNASGSSKDLRSWLWLMRPRSAGPGERWTDHPERDGVYVRRPDGVFSLIAPNPGTANPRVYTNTPDLSHVVLGADYCCPRSNLYEVIGGDQVLRPVGVDNTGAPLPDAGGLCSLGMSDDGRVIYFGSGTNTTGCYKPRARVGDATTIEMSASQCTRGVGDPGGVCNADALANFVGFARDGSRALFTTTQQLVNGDTDASNDLYACDIPAGAVAPTLPVNVCPNLRQLSVGVGGGADVEGVARVSDDGSHVYFVAHGVLAANRGANDQTAVAGAHNLYLWQTDAEYPEGHTTFLARLLADDVAGNSSTQITPDGRYLVVNTATPLVTSGPAADTDSAIDVYRYDSQAGEWLRLSTDTTGSGGNAETGTFVWSRPAIADDGHAVVFITGEALAPADTNSGSDVYAWHEGQVSLISPDGGADNPGISASGNDIYFMTISRLTAADGDTLSDVYSARVGGGFDLREQGPCEGEGCQRPPSAPPGLAPGAGGLGGQGDIQKPAPRFTLRTISAAQRRGMAQTGRVTVTVAANTPGTVSARVTTTINGKPSNGAAARDTMAEPGSVQLTLQLSKKARARLVAKRRLSVKIVVTHSKAALPRSATLRLTLAAKTKKKVTGSSSVGRGSDDRGGRS